MKFSLTKLPKVAWLKNSNRGALLVGAALLLLGGMGAAQAWDHESTIQKTETPTVAKEQTNQNESNSNLDTTAPPVGTPTVDTSHSTTTAPAQSTVPSKTLVITPSSFTVKPGENLQLTIQASDGKAINYPFFTASTNGNFLFNFAASPAKTTWSGPILVYQNTPLGAYTLEIAAQTNGGGVTYRGKITVSVVKPTMNISIQSLDYDAESDVLPYIIKINRLYGFDESVIEVAAGNDNEPGLVCYYVTVDPNTIALGCGHDEASGSRPTSGTLTVSVSTDSVTSSASISYTLPPISQ